MIRSLLYAQLGTHPDISFAVSHLAQYAFNPSLHHIRLAKYVLCYLKGTRDLKLVYDGACGNGLYGHSDSSWADNLDDRRSTSGYVYLLANATISWCSCKQKTVAQSSTEAKYMQLADASNQAMWYHMFLKEFGYEVADLIPILENNQSTVNLAEKPMTGCRSKHILLKYHVIRDYMTSAKFMQAVRALHGYILLELGLLC